MKLLLLASLVSLTALHAAPPDLSKIASRADLDAVIATTADAALKQAFTAHAAEILLAAEQHPHVEAVIRTIESAPGTFTKINTTPEALKKAAGGDIAIFDTLTQISTNILGGKAHDHRKEKEDPYNAAFIEHLGHIPSLETVKLERGPGARQFLCGRQRHPDDPEYLTILGARHFSRGSFATLDS
jgi:hypothetical protein